MYEGLLENLGLTKKQAILYEALLQEGRASAQQLSKLTGLKRSTVYDVARALMERELINQEVAGKTTYFKPAHPYRLRELAHENQLKAQQALSQLEGSLAGLVSVFSKSTNQPGVRIYDGLKGLKQLYESVLEENKEILSIVQPAEVEPSLYKWLTTVFVKKRVRRNIKAKVIVAGGTKEARTFIKLSQKELRESIEIDDPDFRVGIELMVVGDKTYFVSFNKNSDLIGIAIQNEFVSESICSLWKIIWKYGTKE